MIHSSQRLSLEQFTRHSFQSIGVLTSKCTVQPVAVRSSIDVFGENKRLIVEIDSPEFGTLVYVIIAAVQVGSITMTTKEGQAVSKVMPGLPI